MEKYKCIAIDDDLVYLEIFKKLAERVDCIDLVGTFSSAIDGAVGVSKLKPSLSPLIWNMRQMNLKLMLKNMSENLLKDQNN